MIVPYRRTSPGAELWRTCNATIGVTCCLMTPLY